LGWFAGETPLNQIVFIGRDLRRQDLVEGFRSCVWVPLPEGWSEQYDQRTGQPFYISADGQTKQWHRPDFACALVKATETSHRQPKQLQPRLSGEGEPNAP
jgi:hypothetical protein